MHASTQNSEEMMDKMSNRRKVSRSRLLKGIRTGFSAGALVLLSTAAWAASSPTTLYVSPTGSNQQGTGLISSPYRTIQHAVSVAAPGDTIVVEPGTYSGTVTITQDLTLESMTGSAGGPAHTILNVSGDLMGIEVEGAAAAGTTISGLTITNPGSHGIMVLDTSHVTIDHNVVSNTGLDLNPAIPEDKAIILTGTSSSSVVDNTLTNVEDGGISVTDDGALNPALAQPASGVALPADDNIIEGNTITGATHACGIVVAAYNNGGGVNWNQVVDNHIMGNVAGIVIATDTPDSTATHNTVTGNTVTDNGLPGVIVHSNAPGDTLTDTTVTGNTIAGDGADGEIGAYLPTGIAIAGAVTPVMNTQVANNTITQEHYGIYLTGSLGATFADNQITAPVPVAPLLELLGPTRASAGQTLSFTAAAPAMPAAPEYQFWVDSAAHGWQMMQNYSPDPSFSIPSAADGSYVVAAFAMTSAEIAKGDWSAARMAVQAVNVDSSVMLSVMSGSMSMSHAEANSSMTSGSMTSAMGPGMPVTVQATAENLLDPVYQFWVKGPSGKWMQSGGYQTSNMFTLPMNQTPLAATYTVIAYAKDAAAPESAPEEVSSNVVTLIQNPEVDFAVSPGSVTVQPGQSQTFTVTQEYVDGMAASSAYLDNLDATVVIKNAMGVAQTSGFTVSGLGISGTHALTSGSYTFMGTPTAVSGSLTVNVGLHVMPGTYYLTLTDPDHMLQNSNQVAITVKS